MLREVKRKEFANGIVYALETLDGYLIETTDTFLPYYTKNAESTHSNKLLSEAMGSRLERWMIGVSTMSGCPVRCKFCATGSMTKYRNLTDDEIVEQVLFVLARREEKFGSAKEHKINYTRMGEPFLNIENVKSAIRKIDDFFPGTHHYVSTIGVSGSDFSWIKGNITLQLSIHSLFDEKRNWLIPFTKKMSLKELGEIQTASNLKTTINLTLVDDSDFDINVLKELFPPERFFVKLSPINPNPTSYKNGIFEGAIHVES